MAAPSCLCVCGARGGLAQVWHTSGTRVVLPLHVPCRVGWRRSRAHAVPRGREPQRFLRAVAPLGLCAPRIGEAARAPAFPEHSTLTAARIACSATSIRSTGWNSTTSTLPMPTRSRRANARLNSEADARQAGNRRAPATPFGRPRKRGRPYRRLGAGDRVTLSREEKSPRLRVLPRTGAPGCGLACDSEWSSR